MSKSLAFPSQSPHLKLETAFSYMTIVVGMPRKLFSDLSDSLSDDSGALDDILYAWVIDRSTAEAKLPLKDTTFEVAKDEIWLHAHFGIKWSEVMKYTEWDKLKAGQKLMSFCERHKDKLVYTIEHERFG